MECMVILSAVYMLANTENTYLVQTFPEWNSRVGCERLTYHGRDCVSSYAYPCSAYNHRVIDMWSNKYLIYSLCHG